MLLWTGLILNVILTLYHAKIPPPPQNIYHLGENRKLENQVLDIEEWLPEIFRHNKTALWCWIFYLSSPFRDPYWVLCKYALCISFPDNLLHTPGCLRWAWPAGSRVHKQPRGLRPPLFKEAERPRPGHLNMLWAHPQSSHSSPPPHHLPNKIKGGYSQSQIYADLY